MVFGRFLQDRKAGVVPILAVGLIPLMGMIGAAVDYSRAASARTAMQTALDSTALMLSKTAQGLSDPQIDAKATAYFTSLFARPEATNIAVTPVFTTPAAGNFKLVITASANVSTMFWRVMGTQQLSITANSEVVWGIKKLNLALALDNTGSMSNNNKMTELKTAAKNLLTVLQAAEKTPGDIKVSIVPFATDVNVGTTIAASFIDWSDWDTKNGTCSNHNYSTQSSCLSNNKTWTAANHNTWNGCVWDRDQNNDVTDTAPVAGTSSTMFQAHQASSCPVKLMPLSSDWTALKAKVDAMSPTGNTNVTIGMTWAWHTISTKQPFNAPAEAPDLDKVIILLTDGENTQNRWSSSSSSIDARTEKACTNAKAANVRVYTVRVINGDATLLRNCATKTDMYYDVDQAVELNSVFSSIAQNLANLRIVK